MKSAHDRPFTTPLWWWDGMMGYSFFPARFTSCLCAWQILPRWWDGDISGVFAKTGAAKRPTREDRRRNIGNGWEWGKLGYSYSGKIVDQKLRDSQQSTKDGGLCFFFTLKMGWHGWLTSLLESRMCQILCLQVLKRSTAFSRPKDLFQGCSTCSALFWLGILPLLEFFLSFIFKAGDY